MIFEKLKINNFLSASEIELNLHNRGLLLIQGKNLDDMSASSNGAGKSMVVDALCWCLYGQTARGVKADDIVNNKAKKNTSVSIEILDNNDVYTITRYRKHDKFNNSIVITKNEEDISKGLEKDNQELIDSIVGADYDVFCAAVYSGQELMVNLPEMTDKQLKELIGKAIDIQKIETAYSLALTEKSFLAKDIAGKNLEIERFESELSAAVDNYETAQKGKQEWQIDNSNSIEVASYNFKQLALSIKEREKELSLFDSKSLNEKLTSLQQEQGTLYDQKSQYDECGKTLNNLKSKRELLVSKFNNNRDVLKSILSKIESVMNQKVDVCETCGQSLNEKAKATTIENYTKQQEDASQAMLLLKGEVKDIDFLIQKQKDLLETFDFDSENWSQKYNTIAEEIGSINKKIWDFETKQSNLNKDKNFNFTALKKQIEELEHKSNPFESYIENGSKRIQELEEEIKTHKNDLEKLEADLIVSNEVLNVLSPAGVRAHILDTITPYLNEKTNKYLTILSNSNLKAEWSTLTRNKAGAIKEKFSIEVYNAKGGGSFKSLSGGEKRKVRLACGLALQDLISTRATKAISLWIGDEIDDALDTSGLELLTNVLEMKAEEKGTVLIISHNDLKDWCNNSITITKKNGLSTISE